MIRLLACLILSLCAFCITAPNAEACGGRVARFGARVTTAPFRVVRAVHNNRLEARAARGNCNAAARLHAKSARGAY